MSSGSEDVPLYTTRASLGDDIVAHPDTIEAPPDYELATTLQDRLRNASSRLESLQSLYHHTGMCYHDVPTKYRKDSISQPSISIRTVFEPITDGYARPMASALLADIQWKLRQAQASTIEGNLQRGRSLLDEVDDLLQRVDHTIWKLHGEVDEYCQVYLGAFRSFDPRPFMRRSFRRSDQERIRRAWVSHLPRAQELMSQGVIQTTAIEVTLSECKATQDDDAINQMIKEHKRTEREAEDEAHRNLVRLDSHRLNLAVGETLHHRNDSRTLRLANG